MILFPDVPSGAICEEQQGRNDTHEHQNRQIEPQSGNMPRPKDFLAAVERRPANAAIRCKEYLPCPGHDIVIDHLIHMQLVGTNHAVLEFQVMVVALELHKCLLTIVTDKLLHLLVGLQRDKVAPFREDFLGLLHIVA